MNKRKKRLSEVIRIFYEEYRRKHAWWDPNDRQYDHKVQQRVKRMNPLELDERLRYDEFDQRQLDDAAQNDPDELK